MEIGATLLQFLMETRRDLLLPDSLAMEIYNPSYLVVNLSLLDIATFTERPR